MRSAHGFAVLALSFGFTVALPVAASTATASYPQMAPITEYLIADRQTEIDLARSAAPPAISNNATVLVLTLHGYETAATGTNGFTCLIERSWETHSITPSFGTRTCVAPVCYNASATRPCCRTPYFETKMILAHVGKTELLRRLRAAIADKKLPRLEAGSMAYMMSKQQYLNDGAKVWYPHVMVYAPKTAGARGGKAGANSAWFSRRSRYLGSHNARAVDAVLHSRRNVVRQIGRARVLGPAALPAC